jgi:hypothetical protein
VELVVSGRIAAILPWPAAVTDFRPAIAEKSFVNDVVEMLGVVEVDEVAVVVVVEDVVFDELPHPAATSASTTVSAIAPNQREPKVALSSRMGALFGRLVDSVLLGSGPGGPTVADCGAVVH